MTTPDPTRDQRQRWRDLLDEADTGPGAADDPGLEGPELPWSYQTMVRNLVVTAHRVLDLDTGGGELLASLGDVLPEGTVATESSAPRVPVAVDRLAPLGIEVVRHAVGDDQARLPFEEGSFDLVLCRHGAYDAADVARVLAPRGAFLTEQVGADDLREIAESFGTDAQHPEATLMHHQNAMTRAGLTVERADVAHGEYRVAQLGTLLRLLRRAPWAAPAELDVDRHAEVLAGLERDLATGQILATASRFVIMARRPAEPDEGRTDFSALPTDDLVVPEV